MIYLLTIAENSPICISSGDYGCGPCKQPVFFPLGFPLITPCPVVFPVYPDFLSVISVVPLFAPFFNIQSAVTSSLGCGYFAVFSSVIILILLFGSPLFLLHFGTHLIHRQIAVLMIFLRLDVAL